MPLDATLLEILACPKCKAKLEYRVGDKDGEEEVLLCHKCRLAFEVDDGIPIMLIDEARPF